MRRSISPFFLTMMNVATILSIRSWATAAEFGGASFSLILFSALLFFIPIACTSAELATSFPEEGGLFVWIKKALGIRWAFTSVWLLWISNLVWYPTILSFIATSLSYVIYPPLSENPLYLFFMILSLFWGTTFLNLKGVHLLGQLSSFGVFLGTLLPALLIIFLGGIWFIQGSSSFLDFSLKGLIPKISSPEELSLMVAIPLSFCGIEINAVHANDVQNPKKTFPLAIALSTLIVSLFSILGTLSVASVVPSSELSLVAGTIQALELFLNSHNLTSLLPIIALLVSIGSLASVATWIVGPSRALLVAIKESQIFPPLLKVNAHHMPLNLLILQGCVVSLISCLFLFLNLSSSFWIFTVIASQLYLIVYLMLFISLIVLRYREPSRPRAFQIPCGTFGMWTVAGAGIISTLLFFALGLFPPMQVDVGNSLFYILIQAVTIGVSLFLGWSTPSTSRKNPPTS